MNLNNISGTVSLPTTASTSTIQTNGAQKTQIVDGSGNIATIKAASTSAIATDSALVVAISPNNTITNAIIDSSNSTSISLTANSTFTGSFINCSGFSTLSVLIFTDQSSATNGLTVQYSSDGVNIDDNDSYSIVASNGQQFSFGLSSKFYRIVYTNGTVNQTVLRLQSKLHVSPPKSSSVRSSDSISMEQDTELVKSILMGKNPSATYDNIISTGSAELRVARISNGSGVQGALTVGTSAVLVAVSGTNLANRVNVTVYNNSLVLMYWGYLNTVTTSTGTLIQPSQSISWDVGPNTSIYLIASTASNNARITEAAG